MGLVIFLAGYVESIRSYNNKMNYYNSLKMTNCFLAVLCLCPSSSAVVLVKNGAVLRVPGCFPVFLVVFSTLDLLYTETKRKEGYDSLKMAHCCLPLFLLRVLPAVPASRRPPDPATAVESQLS